MVATSGSNDAYVFALDAATGAAITAFGTASSGIQTFGSTTGGDIANSLVLTWRVSCMAVPFEKVAL